MDIITKSDRWIYDHENFKMVFDIARSGAVLAWKYFNEEIPPMAHIIEDRDLWLWKLPHSKEINAALEGRGFKEDFKVGGPLLLSWGAMTEQTLISEG